MAEENPSFEMEAPPRTLDFHDSLFPGSAFGRAVVLAAVFTLMGCIAAVQAQSADSSPPSQNPLQGHYDAAQSFQAAGDLNQAAFEYRAFLAAALDRLAHDRAAAGDYPSAVPLFQQSLNLAPLDSGIRLDYAEAAIVAQDFAKARLLAQETLDSDPTNAKAHLDLGRVLLHLKDGQLAKAQFEAAVALDSNFEDGYGLATACLALKDEKGAAKIFAEMLAGFGDTAEIHLAVGRAYAEAGFPEHAVQEFKLAIAKDDNLPHAHYSLGAAYLQVMGEINYPLAVAEFEKELQINPNDFLSHLELGTIALNQHKLQEAETELTRAAALGPQYPDVFLSLGQLYTEMNRPSDAEAALRKAISLTKDVSENHYQVQRAFYLLARILLQSGREEEGLKDMKISGELLHQSTLENQGESSGTQAAANPPWKDVGMDQTVDPGALKEVESFQARVAPAIADSYNNLGVIAASGNNFAAALGYFQAASEWNPSLDGLDYNWGRAAFSAKQYDQAAGPLGRYLQSHPDDDWARSALGLSLFKLKNYSDALKILQPMESQVGADPSLALAYAVSLTEAGDFDSGIARLKSLETANPDKADIHAALGEALAWHGKYREAAEELRTAVRLAPTETDAKYHLALSEIELGQKDEAQGILTAMARQGSQDFGVYDQLGRLQLERDEVKAAIASFETAARINPDNESIHLELATAYRRASRPLEAEREKKRYEAIEREHSQTKGPSNPK